VYDALSQKYLQSYLDEHSFRYNRRDDGTPMFKLMFGRVSENYGNRASDKCLKYNMLG
jgi:hypothetical protein